jgi:hypothetical protein
MVRCKFLRQCQSKQEAESGKKALEVVPSMAHERLFGSFQVPVAGKDMKSGTSTDSKEGSQRLSPLWDAQWKWATSIWGPVLVFILTMLSLNTGMKPPAPQVAVALTNEGNRKRAQWATIVVARKVRI